MVGGTGSIDIVVKHKGELVHPMSLDSNKVYRISSKRYGSAFMPSHLAVPYKKGSEVYSRIVELHNNTPEKWPLDTGEIRVEEVEFPEGFRFNKRKSKEAKK